MINSLVKIGLILVVGILVYNRFFGTDSEKESSKKVFHEVGDVARSVGSLLRSEKEKFDAGKYDRALSKLGEAYQGLKKQAQFLDENVVKRLDAAEKRRLELEKQLNDLENQPDDDDAPPAKNNGFSKQKTDETTSAKAADRKAQQEKLHRELQDLTKEFEGISNEAINNQ